MKTICFLMTTFMSAMVIFSSPALAHEDHFLGDGLLHSFYHIAFIGLCLLIAIKAYKWIKAKRIAKRLAK